MQKKNYVSPSFEIIKIDVETPLASSITAGTKDLDKGGNPFSEDDGSYPNPFN